MKITRTLDLVNLRCPLLILKVKHEFASTDNTIGWCLKVCGETSLNSLQYFLKQSRYVFQVIHEDTQQSHFDVLILSKVKPK